MACSTDHGGVEEFVQDVISNKKVQSTDLPSGRLIGKGLSGIVYETEWEGQSCARKDFLRVPSDIFEREAAVLVGLVHPNVVRTCCWTVDEGSCSLVSELMDDNLLNLMRKRIASRREKGPKSGSHLIDLQKFIEDCKNSLVIAASESVASPLVHPFDMRDTLHIIVQIAEGMKFLHDNGVVHGDLKPKNVLIVSPATLNVKVADFGLVGTKMKSKSLVSRRARNLEMLRWRAPEVLNLREGKDQSSTDLEWDSDSSDGNIDVHIHEFTFASDVFNFASTCSQILTGEDPYSGLGVNDLVREIPRGLRPRLPPTCPAELRDLIESCWGEKGGRPSFESILRDLKVILPAPLTEGGHPTLQTDSRGVNVKPESSVYVKEQAIPDKPPVERLESLPEGFADSGESSGKSGASSNLLSLGEINQEVDVPRGPTCKKNSGVGVVLDKADQPETSEAHHSHTEAQLKIDARQENNGCVTFNSGDRRLNILVLGDSELVKTVVGYICGAGKHTRVQDHVNLTESRNSWPPMCLYGYTKGTIGKNFTDIKNFVKVRNKRWHRTNVKALWADKETHNESPGERSALFPDSALRLHMVWFVCTKISDCPNRFRWSDITKRLYGLPVQILVVGTQRTQDLDLEYNKIFQYGKGWLFPNAQELEELIVEVALKDGDLKKNLWQKCWAAKTRAEIENASEVIRDIRNELGSARISDPLGFGIPKQVSYWRSGEFVLKFLCAYWDIPHDSVHGLLQRIPSFEQGPGDTFSTKPSKFVKFCLTVAAIILYNARDNAGNPKYVCNWDITEESNRQLLQTEAQECYYSYFATSINPSNYPIRAFLQSIFERKGWALEGEGSGVSNNFITEEGISTPSSSGRMAYDGDGLPNYRVMFPAASRESARGSDPWLASGDRASVGSGNSTVTSTVSHRKKKSRRKKKSSAWCSCFSASSPQGWTYP